jgi:hypothetical protein
VLGKAHHMDIRFGARVEARLLRPAAERRDTVEVVAARVLLFLKPVSDGPE